ncbi:hypothetical protein [Telmatospirillum siberiense]|uniref:Uncharacterized protein n=1 Tax=Telmatospirillum siberiense TaxID=382514 RepID=A0A2N3PVT7_9PROT|nr:hypothetical protein [Telmatospirillum siberiense]PKU24498.1 hypothetical protein CWS72_11680 [Telmatospirillum siberiense]
MASLILSRTIRKTALVVLTAFSLSACAEQTDWIKEQMGQKLPIEINPVTVEKIRSDAAAKGSKVDETVITRSLTETVRDPNRFQWFATLIEPDGGGLLYVGTRSTKAPDDTIRTDVIFKSSTRGTLDIHLTLERRDQMWTQQPDTYGMTEEPVNQTRKPDSKRK